MWILTREINQYDQDGAYFEAAWLNKPVAKQINDILGRKWLPQTQYETYAQYLLKTGGGRVESEDEWWNLFEYGS